MTRRTDGASGARASDSDRAAVGVGLGKIILFGEHAVVYGHPAVAGAIERCARAWVSPGGGDDGGGQAASEPGVPAVVRLRVPRWGLVVDSTQDHPVGAAGRALLAALARHGAGGAGQPGVSAPGPDVLEVEMDAELPAAAGLGSSAAMSVALARLLVRRAGEAGGEADAPDSPDALAVRIRAAADAAERCFHDNPSGVDVALAMAGGWGVFRRDAGLAPLAAPPLPLAIGLSGELRATRALVRGVAARRAADQDATDAALARLGWIAEQGAEALSGEDHETLGRLMIEAHAALARLGCSTPRLDAMVAAATGAGALGAKLTGAGGGGAVIALAPGREDAVLAAWRALGCDGFACRAGVSP